LKCVCSICLGKTTIFFTVCLVLLQRVLSSCAQQESKESSIWDVVEPDGYRSSTCNSLFTAMNGNPR
jgi:hypothetical protein